MDADYPAKGSNLHAGRHLMLMCYDHHVETNDVDKFDAPRLRQMKLDHEKRFSSPDRAIRETLKDWTDIDQSSRIENLIALSRTLNWGLNTAELQELSSESRN
ncbi:hypothetical protein ABIA22_004662 [Sinorhizobium fredii]|uniref:hypothetical protein n=1 Tax=Rhizobium fredii TaxID=380 RepID=UPI003517C8EA